MRFIGVDPGLFGAIATIHDDDRLPEWIRMPTVKVGKKSAIDGAGVRNRLFYPHDPALVAIEKVGAMPKQGSASGVNFGAGWGKIQGVCDGLQMPYVLVQPQAWKKRILTGLGTDKSATIRYCMMRWPTLSLIAPGCRVLHDGAADALCLALYAKLSA